MTVNVSIKPINRRNRHLGSLSIEMFVAIAIMVALFGLLAKFGNSIKKVDDHHWVQYTLTNAGQAQLDAIAATGKPIDENAFVRLWPTVTCNINISDGTGQWSGLQKVQLYLSAKSRRETIHIDLTRYISSNKEVLK